jgi:hypothetical protein
VKLFVAPVKVIEQLTRSPQPIGSGLVGSRHERGSGSVGRGVGVAVGVAVRVGVSVGVSAAVAVSVGVSLTVADGVGVGVSGDVSVGVLVAVVSGSAVAVSVSVALGVGSLSPAQPGDAAKGHVNATSRRKRRTGPRTHEQCAPGLGEDHMRNLFHCPCHVALCQFGTRDPAVRVPVPDASPPEAAEVNRAALQSAHAGADSVWKVTSNALPVW